MKIKDNLPTLFVGLIVAFSFIMVINHAKADVNKVLNDIGSVPGKLQNHIQMEVEKTKEYQKNSWAEAKAQWLRLKAKFIKG